jgi:N-acetylglucosamine-6-phosphate deacetylase
MATLLKNARLLTPKEDIDFGYVLIDGGMIRAVGADGDLVVSGLPEDTEVIDLQGLTMVPGFIDLHVNGGGGSDLLGGGLNAFERTASFLISHGVTAFVASLITGPAEQTSHALEAARAYQQANYQHLPHLLGVHLEGPYISAAKRGVHPQQFLRPPSLEELYRFQKSADGCVRIVTIAPELPGALEFIEVINKEGIIAALGHTDATFQQAKKAIDAGVSYVTHMFNAMRPFHHREPGAAGAVLDSGGLILEVISDGYHLSPAAQRLLLRLIGPDHLVLVSDSVSAAGARPSAKTFPLGMTRVQVKEGKAVDDQGLLAGSLLTMDKAVINFVDYAGCPLLRSVAMATAIPARVLGLAGKKGCIKAGADADLAILDDDFRVKRVYLRGKAVFPR